MYNKSLERFLTTKGGGTYTMSRKGTNTRMISLTITFDPIAVNAVLKPE